MTNYLTLRINAVHARSLFGLIAKAAEEAFGDD
jgi:hypothetical protein